METAIAGGGEPNRMTGRRPPTAATEEPVVVVKGVHKTYMPSPWWLKLLLRSAIDDPVVALNSVDLEVRPGEILAVVGPNGAGKSTLFRILTGLTTPTTGSASVCGYDCSSQSSQARRKVGFMPAEDRTLFLRYSCYENLLFHGRMQGLRESVIQRRIDEVLEITDLTAARDRAGFALSSGMRARLQLARALLPQPPVLILDEPTGPVDPVSAHGFLQTLRAVTAERKTAVLLSSHRLEEIDALSESVVLLSDGRVIFRGDLDDLRTITERPRYHIGFRNADVAAQAAARLGSAGLDEVHPLATDDEHALLVSTDRPAGELLRALGADAVHVTSIVEARMPLRDLFVHVLDQHGTLTRPGDS